ncbi:MAG: SLBB domain-containing protein [Sterolibacterium sp.]|jgi:protein involved in polysaccharide export with SLBB domain
MAFSLRRVLISVFLGLLPLATQAQTLGQDVFRSQQSADATSQGAGMQHAVPTSGNLVLPSIGNAALQRQQRTGRQADQVLDPRTGLPIDPRTQQTIQDLQPPQERIEFQDFVAQSTGRDLPIFGAELFKNVPSTFAPVDNAPVTSDYLIGPGDEIMIRAWGQLDIDLSAVVDRTGAINIPKVGTINVAGIKYQDLQSHLKAAIGRVFRNFDLTVSLGQLRSIQVFVVGQARRPGSYTIGSMSTLVNAIFAAGGPSAKGSMRGIQLKRGNKVVTELDLYDLLINGDKSKDAQLLPGDVIYVPSVGALVAISGSVNVPAIFELKKGGTLGDLIAWAGGLASTASGQKATVERIDDHKARQVTEFKLDSAGMQANLRNGDLVNIYAITPRFENAVTLRGNVAQPGRFPWREGMRVKDLIPKVDALISRHYWLHKNQTVGMESAVADVLRRNRAVGVDIPVTDLLKKNKERDADLTVAESMQNTQLSADVATANADAAKRLTASKGLGIGQGTQAGEKETAPGAKLSDEIKRNLSEVNWDYAVIERMNPKDLTTTLVPFNLGKAILENDPAQNLLLQPGDVVTIFSVDDIQVPIAKQTKYVRLEGEFANPGIYRVEPGETLRQLVARVGGLSPNAYLFGSEFTRETTRIYQQKKLDEAVNRLEREIQSAAISASKNVTTAEEAAGLTQNAQAQQGLVAKLRQVKATGRIVLEIPPDETAGLKDLPDIALEDSDRFTVPSQPSMINVVGAVYNENAFVFKPEKRLTDYLRQAGGVSRTGDKADVYLLRVDGSVISKRQSGWLMGSFDGERLMPGDTIVVPEDFERQTWTKVLKDYGQILYQFGLGAAAIKILKP